MNRKGSTMLIIGIILAILIVGIFSYFAFFSEEKNGKEQSEQNTEGSQNEQSQICVENWSCGEWSECINSQQTRTCTDLNNCDTIENKPTEIQSCTEEIVQCSENWDCGEWGECQYGFQTRTCIDLNDCGTSHNKPFVFQTCEYEIETCGDGICEASPTENMFNCWEDCKPEFNSNNFVIYGERDSTGSIIIGGTKSCSGTYQPNCCSETKTEYKDYNAYYTCDYIEGLCDPSFDVLDFCRQKCSDFGLEVEYSDVTGGRYSYDPETGELIDSLGFYQCSCKVC